MTNSGATCNCFALVLPSVNPKMSFVVFSVANIAQRYNAKCICRFMHLNSVTNQVKLLLNTEKYLCTF